jgi:hypothetical protein
MDDLESPFIITSEKNVIDLVKTDPVIWTDYISPGNKQRVIGEVQRWKSAVASGAGATHAYGYAVSGAGLDYQTWLDNE